MKNWNKLKIILNNQKMSVNDQQLIRDFLVSFSFKKRQQLMSIFIGFPEKIGFLTELIKKKKTLIEKFDANLAQEVLDLENKEIDNLI